MGSTRSRAGGGSGGGAGSGGTGSVSTPSGAASSKVTFETRSIAGAFASGAGSSGGGVTPAATQAAAPPAAPAQIVSSFARAAIPAPRVPPAAATWETAESFPPPPTGSRDWTAVANS